jgi:NADPH-dependent 7-cyano-7-deazaguanine reductase QueF
VTPISDKRTIHPEITVLQADCPEAGQTAFRTVVVQYRGSGACMALKKTP